MHPPRRSSAPRRVPILLLAATIPTLFAASPGQAPADATDDAAALLARFDKLPSSRQEQVLNVVAREASHAADGLGDPWLTAIRALVEESSSATEPRLRTNKTAPRYKASETAVDVAHPLVRQLPVTAGVAYQFGYGTIVPYHPGGKAPSRAEFAHQRRATLESLLAGRRPGLDRAFAALLRRLDDQRAIDRYAAFLESWANGAETFYDALDRTAGTEDAIFHYDAMLTAWVDECVPHGDPQRDVFAKGPAAAQSGFRAAFQNYRSYRSTRELLAFAMVFEDTDPLPATLARYESDGGPDQHTMRDLVELMLIAADGDPRGVAEQFRTHAPPLGVDAWNGTHDAWRGIRASFDAIRDDVMARGPSTFEVLRVRREERATLRQRLAQAARTTLADALDHP